MPTKRFDEEIYNQDNVIVEEAYSFLKANISFHNSGKTIRSLSILSCNPAEGKTTTAINLAISFVRSGVKVLFVDTDLRKPIAAKRLGGDNYEGLSDVLTKNKSLDDVIMSTNIQNLYYLPSGLKVSYPAELLSSDAFNRFLKDTAERFELTILDTPALSSVIDATVVASKSDASILVIKSGKVKLSKLQRVKESLQKANVNVLGAVLNVVDKSEYRKHLEAYDYFKDESRFLKISRHYKYKDRAYHCQY